VSRSLPSHLTSALELSSPAPAYGKTHLQKVAAQPPCAPPSTDLPGATELPLPALLADYAEGSSASAVFSPFFAGNKLGMQSFLRRLADPRYWRWQVGNAVDFILDLVDPGYWRWRWASAAPASRRLLGGLLVGVAGLRGFLAAGGLTEVTGTPAAFVTPTQRVVTVIRTVKRTVGTETVLRTIEVQAPASGEHVVTSVQTQTVVQSRHGAPVTVSNSVTGPTHTVTTRASGSARTVTVTTAPGRVVTVTGPTRTVTGPITAVTGPTRTVTDTVTQPAETITQTEVVTSTDTVTTPAVTVTETVKRGK